jgi:hypothetical protein
MSTEKNWTKLNWRKNWLPLQTMNSNYWWTGGSNGRSPNGTRPNHHRIAYRWSM